MSGTKSRPCKIHSVLIRICLDPEQPLQLKPPKTEYFTFVRRLVTGAVVIVATDLSSISLLSYAKDLN